MKFMSGQVSSGSQSDLGRETDANPITDSLYVPLMFASHGVSMLKLMHVWLLCCIAEQFQGGPSDLSSFFFRQR